MTILHEAVIKGNHEIVQLILDNNPDISIEKADNVHKKLIINLIIINYYIIVWLDASSVCC